MRASKEAAVRITRDARAFGSRPETGTCTGWTMQAIEGLCNKTHAEWEKYGHQVNQLPEDIREHYLRIHKEAFKHARAAGRDASQDDD